MILAVSSCALRFYSWMQWVASRERGRAIRTAYFTPCCPHLMQNQRLALCFALPVIVGAVATRPALAQGAIPDAHWGAYSIPSSVPELRGGMHFSRFTEFSSSGNQFNETDVTAGFNFLVGSYTDRVPGWSNWTYTSSIGLGLSADEPTQTLQNDYVHELNPQGSVPVGVDREEVEFMGALSATYWLDLDEELGNDLFFGGGVGTSTLYHEPHVYAGGRWMATERIRVSFMHRFSRPVEGQAYQDVAQTNNLTQLYLGYLPKQTNSSSSFARFLGNPEFGVAITHDTGLFVDSNDDPIDVWFASIRFKWATGLSVETWNDFANGTDFGPTYGFLFSWDLTTLSGSFFDILN